MPLPAASMRPRHYTAENLFGARRRVVGVPGASMRPRHYTAENPTARPPGRRRCRRFNEAAALHRGKPPCTADPRHRQSRFNEAAALHRGKPIRCGHRPYHGLSKSERWRIDALLGAAVASLSGHRLLVLDESDMLQPGLRPSLLGWLDALVTAGHLETALVMATTREPFRVPKHVAQFRLPMVDAAGEEAAA